MEELNINVSELFEPEKEELIKLLKICAKAKSKSMGEITLNESIDSSKFHKDFRFS